jgi:hypothetical protein
MSPADIGAIVNESNEVMPNVSDSKPGASYAILRWLEK